MLGRRCHFCNNRVRGIRGRIWTCPLCEATNAIAEDGTDIFLPAYARPQHRFKPLRLYMEKPSYNPSRRLCETCDYRLEQYTSAYNAAPTAGERRKLQKTRPELCAACKLRLANATKPCTSTVARVWVHRLWRLASLVARLIALLMMPLLPFWPAGLTILTSLSILRAGWVRLFPHTIACLQPSPDGRFDELATIIDDMNIDETSSQPDRPRRMPMWRCLLALTPLLPLPLSLAGPAIAMAVCAAEWTLPAMVLGASGAVMPGVVWWIGRNWMWMAAPALTVSLAWGGGVSWCVGDAGRLYAAWATWKSLSLSMLR